VLTVILFITFVLFVHVAGHLYVAKRLSAGATPGVRRATQVAVVTQAVLIVLAFSLLRGDTLGRGWQVPLQWAGMLALGFFSLEMFFLIAIDVGDWVWRRWQTLRSREVEVDPSRRALLLRPMRLGALAVTGAIAGIGVKQAYMAAEVVEVDVPIADLPDALSGFRIVQVSDIHVGPTIRRPFLEGIVRRVNELEADLVAVTGDLMDGTVTALGDDVEPIADLQSRHGTYFITGNHEYYSGAEEWIAYLRERGVKVLLNEHVVLEHGGANLLLAGVTDYRAGNRLAGHESDPVQAARDAPPCPARILLAHQPRSAYAAAATGAFDLQLSGHTHGGQYVPFSWLVHAFQPSNVGPHRHEGMWIYTNRGTGYWGPPIRAGVRPEITRITLRRAT
jgi:predicted MPP superfamily phosphohydrolase